MPTTSELLLEWDRKRPRTLQREIGMSSLGDCDRKVGYMLAGTEPVNPPGSVVAAMGSAIHDAIADILTDLELTGVTHERAVTFAGITGHYDRVEGDVLIDVKTTSSRWLEHLKLHGPEHDHLWQVSCYAAALIRDGQMIRRVRIDYLARDNGEEYNWPSLEGAPFNPQHVKDALAWLKTVRDAELEMLPRQYDPDSTRCRSCPFGGMDGGICWEGHVTGRDLRSARYVDDPDAGKWAQQLWDARNAVKPHKAAEAEARGALTGVVDPNGVPTRCGEFWLRVDARGAMKFVSEPREIEISA